MPLRPSFLGVRLPLLAACTLMMAGAAPADPVRDLAGRYSWHFRNGNIDGERYDSDDVLEIVPVDASHAYFRIELNFFNGHMCSLYGLARREGAKLDYRGAPLGYATGMPCHMSLYRKGADVRMDDNGGTCQDTCGSRGGYASATLPWKSKRPIRYLAQLKASSQYREAVGGAAQE